MGSQSIPSRGWAVIFLFLAGCSGPYSSPTVSAKTETKPIAVHASPIGLRTIPEVITATGELSAEDTAVISVKVAGRVEKLNVDLGSVVEQGQVLAELEKDDYTFRVKQAEALVEQTRARLGLSKDSDDRVNPLETSAVKQAAASLKEAQLMFNNSSELFKQGVVSNVDYQRAGVALAAAEARRQGAVESIFQAQAELLERRAALSLARQQLVDTTIRAPFHGAITKRQTSTGEYLPINAPVVTLVRENPLRLRLQIPERLAAKVRPGQQIDVHVEGMTLQRSGKVVRLSPSIEAQNRALLVEAEIPNADSALRAGSFAEGAITVNPQAQGIAVPQNSIVNFAGVDRVFVAEKGLIAERIIKLGRHLENDTVEIVSGLKPGEMVIAEPGDKMTIGQSVTVSK